MGSACCIAARDKDLPIRTLGDPLHRNVRCSPSSSFRLENRRLVVAGEIEYSSNQMSGGLSGDDSLEMKGALGSDNGIISDGGSLRESFGSPISLKSPLNEGMGVNLIKQSSDISVDSKYTTVRDVSESPDVADLSTSKISFCANPSSSIPVVDSLPHCSTPSRLVRFSPGHRLLRQISDSRILGLKSPNDYSFCEGRASSQGGSSDGWSMRTFSELVASSQRERWPFESEHLNAGFGKISGCSSRFSCSPSLDVQTCGACSESLSDSWRSHELSAVAVLVCGHVYHAECLESMTLEADRYDPACPICVGGEKQITKMSRKALKAEADLKTKGRKISKNRVVDSCVSSDSDDLGHQKDAIHKGKAPKIGTSSNAASSSTKPFLRRHFSFGSKFRSLSENDTLRKKRFWSRYLKD